MAFQREKQSISASQLLQALADGDDIKLSQCTVTGNLDINRLFDINEKFQTQKLAINQQDNCKTLTFSQPIVFDKCTLKKMPFLQDHGMILTAYGSSSNPIAFSIAPPSKLRQDSGTQDSTRSLALMAAALQAWSHSKIPSLKKTQNSEPLYSADIRSSETAPSKLPQDLQTLIS